MIALGITGEEIEKANITKSYEGIAKKLQVFFAKSLIQNSTKTAIRMDEKTAHYMHELRNANNRKIINLQMLNEDQEVYPAAIRTLMNYYADLIQDNFFCVEDLKTISSNLVMTSSITRKFAGTKDEDFIKYIVTTTPEIYDFNETMLRSAEEKEREKGKIIDISFDRKIALEFGAEFLSTRSDHEFLRLLEEHKIITEEQKRSLTRTYREIGREGLIKERYIQPEWAEKQKRQVEATARRYNEQAERGIGE